ncbi:MBL fold metallo-hydrolase [Chromobacterium sp. Beijing]|nr:MBL fold metallo-hydrolase [Chromobacterium sp. Beijing]UJB31834.1 MBL fold metallo-hydrolase [Chromobacterium sp. Beijing]
MKRYPLLIAILGLALMAPVLPSFASTPSEHEAAIKQLPSVYRLALGDARVTALSAGTVDLDLHKLLQGAAPKRIDQLLVRGFLENPVRTSINVFLVETGGRRVLVDTGSGELFGGNVSRLMESLTVAGVQPDQIDDILITHAHLDHIGGLVLGGRLSSAMRPYTSARLTWLSICSRYVPRCLMRMLGRQKLPRKCCVPMSMQEKSNYSQARPKWCPASLQPCTEAIRQAVRFLHWSARTRRSALWET